MTEAWRGFVARRSWTGISFWDCVHVSLEQLHGTCGLGREAHNLADCLAGILGRQREGGLKAGVDILEDDEGLVRPLALAIVLCGEADLDCVGAAKGDRLRERFLCTESSGGGVRREYRA